jgi:polyisoprenoid-binding protein YceI
MKIRAGLFLALVGVFSSSAGAAPADAPVPTRFLGECDIAFLVPSTLHDVSGSARCQPFPVRIARDPSGKEVITVVEVEVPVASMNTRNKSRDGQMREMFRSDRFPRIRGEARNVDVERIRVEFGKVRGGDVSIDLLLRIRDVERKVRATASNLRESGERVTFDLEFPLSLGEFGLKAPSVLGFIRVGDKVSVKATFTLTVSRSP